jgi:hypothetical protein
MLITLNYRRNREAARLFHQKIIDAQLSDAILTKATVMLGLGKKKLIVMDDIQELSILMDFALYEVRQKDGKNQIERYAETTGANDEKEKELLAAMRVAKTGLFKVVATIPGAPRIEMQDLLNTGKTIQLTDIHFSQTLQSKLVVFFRPIHLPRFTMTSGIAFIFPQKSEELLLREWNRLENKGDAERYVWFYKESKKSSFLTAFV